ncbi:hypothetical protein SDC9_179540 [bioreactor metagenome]|uniref:Leucine-rich repeat domain-containing protein n=1 Tax=bioreactor metagenome TaxID=1076179 RepID=A0A645H712_9ZZZZ
MGKSAFKGCTNLTSLVILDGVTSIGYSAFSDFTTLTDIRIPSSVASIEWYAFSGCTNVQAFYFEGDSPSIKGQFSQGVVNYLPWTTGWKQMAGGRRTALWQPRLQSFSAGVAAKTNHFGFNIQWAAGAEARVDACVDLANPDWKPVATNTVGSDGLAYFTDPDSTNYPTRFYRVRWP